MKNDKGHYCMEELQDFCNLHNPGYRITERDVEKVNRLITWIRKDRTEAGEIHPATGDIVEYTTRSGEYYGRSHIEYIGDDSITVCLHPDIPFCHEDTDGIRYTTHGKSYSTLDRKSLEPAHRTQGVQDMGTCRTESPWNRPFPGIRAYVALY